MGIKGAKTSKEHLAHIGFVVAIGIFQKEHIGCLRHHQTAIAEHHSRRDTQAFGKTGEFIGFAIFIGVFANEDIVTTPTRFTLIGIIFGNQHIHSTAFIPGNGDGVHHVGFCGKKLQIELHGHLNVFHTFFGREGILAVLNAGSLFIIRQFGFPIHKSFGFQSRVCFSSVVVDGPEDAAQDQGMKTFILPGVFIMTVGGVKNPTFAVAARPGIRFGFGIGFVLELVCLDFAYGQNIVVWLQLAVQVGFIKCFERF